jgi:hypothetical protein
MATDQKCLWPGYVYPSIWDPATPWLAWARQAQPGQTRVGSVAVMNPASGPGTAVVSDYTGAVNHARNLKHRVVGYVHTSYAARAIATVKAEIDQYYAWYDVDGVFVDEMSNLSTDSAYYRSIYTYVLGKPVGSRLVVGNPGSAAATDWQLNGATKSADILVVFEGTAATYLAWTPPAWTGSYPVDAFGHLVYATAAVDLPTVVAHSQATRAGYRYITDDDVPNPWDTLGHWPAQATP